MQTYKLIPGCCENCTKRVRTPAGLMIVRLRLARFEGDLAEATRRLLESK